MLQFNLQTAKGYFLDRGIVRKQVGEIAVKGLSKAGAFIKTTAERALRYRSRSSSPGEPPTSWRAGAIRPDGTRTKRGPLLRKFMFYAFDPATQSVVVGPAALPGKRQRTPSILERGGEALNSRRRVRRVGGSGEVEIGAAAAARGKATTRKTVKDASGKQVQVIYAYLWSGDQAARANRLNAQLYGPDEISIAPRPYMGPSLTKARPRIASMFSGRVA